MKIVKLLSLLLTMSLMGCAINGTPTLDQPEHPEVYSKFVGVPAILGLQGSYVQLDDEWAITAAHNKPVFLGYDFIKHPTCDLALVKMSGTANTKMDTIYKDEVDSGITPELEFVGYPIGMPQARNTGNLITILDAPMNSDESCLSLVSDAVVIGGMSGGGIYRKDNGKLVGITIAVVHKIFGAEYDIPESERQSAGVYLWWYRDWIKETTGNDYFEYRGAK